MYLGVRESFAMIFAKGKLRFAKILRSTSRLDNIRFQEIPRKNSRKIRDGSAIVATKENASSIGPWPMSWKQRVVSVILDIMKHV